MASANSAPGTARTTICHSAGSHCTSQKRALNGALSTVLTVDHIAALLDVAESLELLADVLVAVGRLHAGQLLLQHVRHELVGAGIAGERREALDALEQVLFKTDLLFVEHLHSLEDVGLKPDLQRCHVRGL